MRLSTFLVAATIALLLAPPAFAKGPYGTIKVGGWTGGAYTDDKTQVFTHCGAGASYRSGIYVIVTQNTGRVWSLGFAKPSFNLPNGEVFPVDITFDGQDQLHLSGVALTSELLVVDLPPSALTDLRKAHVMMVEAKDATYHFDLASTDKLVATIATCVSKTESVGIAHVGNFSTPITPAVESTPSSSSASSKGDSQKAQTFEQNGTGFVVSTNGNIISNFHVIDGCVGDIHGNLTGQSMSPLRIVSKDETNDLALLQASNTFNDVATIRATAIRPGDSIIAIGYPLHGFLTSDFTVTSGIVSSLSGLLNDTRYLQISAGVQSGNSGGPLLDTSGNVVGVVAAKLNAIKFAKATGDLPQNINFAIKIRHQDRCDARFSR
jgi:S1-C subfamily serine protease